MAGQVAVVTGSAGGLGSAIVRRLAGDGMTVVGIDMARAEESAAVEQTVCDIADHAAFGAALDDIAARHGTIRVLVNNAAFYRPCDFLEIGMDQVGRSMEVNVVSVFFSCRHVAKALIAAGGGGSIVNIASISGEIGSPATDYAASKAAVINLTKSIAKLLAAHDIRVNAVAPGTIRAGMGLRMAPGNMERMMALTPMKRLAEAEEVAAVVGFLAGPQASFVTGSTYDVNGGGH